MESYGNFRDAVVRQFSKDKSVVRVQFEFHNRLQESSESVTEYITALRSLAADCSFGGKHSERIALPTCSRMSQQDRKNELPRMRTLDMDEIINTLRTRKLLSRRRTSWKENRRWVISRR